PRVFIVQFTCFPYVFRKLIIHESSKPGNHYGRPVLLLLGLNATAPFLSCMEICEHQRRINLGLLFMAPAKETK
ncbi:MAG: hypothetical protein PUC27_04790, partial [Clostridium sp.]|nr:hypothetical protein [Clostridium sp.]